jgi:replicative DNA helicase
MPIVCLSQLSRQPETRTDKRPVLSDLRESGAQEQDADMVIFPFRPVYYNPNQIPADLCEFHIAKYRNGKVGFVKGAFNLMFQKLGETG